MNTKKKNYGYCGCGQPAVNSRGCAECDEKDRRSGIYYGVLLHNKPPERLAVGQKKLMPVFFEEEGTPEHVLEMFSMLDKVVAV